MQPQTAAIGLAQPGPIWERLGAWVERALTAEQGRLVLWLPVCMGTGVAVYFGLRSEPPLWLGPALAVPACAAAVLARGWVRAVVAVLAAAAIGFSSAELRTWRAPPLEALPHHAVVLTGRVRAVETLPEGRRVTLGPVRLDEEAMLGRFIRVRLRSNDPITLGVGDMMMVRALVRAPSPPSYPGGWDLQRDAYFAGLAGYGFAIGQANVLTRAPPGGFRGHVQALRETIATRIHAVLPGAEGAVSATLLTGDPSAIPLADRNAFRDSGLAHLLAVAGLHIGIVMGLVLGASRRLLAACEYTALHWPTKRIAALAALAAGGAYMVLTGMHVPIVRSFAMACLFTLAVLTGRRAVSLRGLAVAATVLMLVSPQEVPGVSFQMSFSAVLALISGYEALRPRLGSLRGDGSPSRRVALHIAGLALTSALAGTASAPFAAYHFGHIQVYFVVSNMVAVPLTALWVMPAGLISLALMPLHLERIALVPMGWGAGLVLDIARFTASLPAATWNIPHPPLWGLLAVGLGIAWVGIWRGPIRFAGVAVLAVGCASPWMLRPPDMLVAADAKLVGLRTEQGMWVERITGASKFTLDAWREYWAAGPPSRLPSQGAVASGEVDCTPDACVFRPVLDGPAALLLRRAAPEGCAGAAVLVSTERARGVCPEAALIDRITLARGGATAVWLEPSGVRIWTDREARGVRPWAPDRKRRAEPRAGSAGPSG